LPGRSIHPFHKFSAYGSNFSPYAHNKTLTALPGAARVIVIVFIQQQGLLIPFSGIPLTYPDKKEAPNAAAHMVRVGTPEFGDTCDYSSPS
jgi:hypothetical protein